MNKGEHFYHGSSVGGIRLFMPQPHVVAGNKEIVFATDDRAYALAMIYGGGNDLAVSFATNPQTGTREMYVDELKQGALALLDRSGYLYEVLPKYFIPSPEGLEAEYISYQEVPVADEILIANILQELRSLPTVHLVQYDEVLQSMERRNDLSNKPAVEHSADRFV